MVIQGYVKKKSVSLMGMFIKRKKNSQILVLYVFTCLANKVEFNETQRWSHSNSSIMAFNFSQTLERISSLKSLLCHVCKATVVLINSTRS